jgi:hypothetical protein
MHRVAASGKRFHLAKYTADPFREEIQYRTFLNILKKGGKPKSMSKEVLGRFESHRENSVSNDFFRVDLAAITKCMYLVSVVWNSNWYQEKFLSILFSTFAPFDQNADVTDTNTRRESIFLIADGELHAENLVEMFDAICQFAAEQIKKKPDEGLSCLSHAALQREIAPIITAPLRRFAREACLVDNAIVDDRVEWLLEYATKYILHKAEQDKKKTPIKYALDEISVELKQWFVQQADSMGEKWLRENDYTFLLGVRACGVGDDVITDDAWFKLTDVEEKLDFLDCLFREGKIHFRIERWQKWAEQAKELSITEQEFSVAMRATESLVNGVESDSKDINILGESVIHDLRKSKGIEKSIRSFLSEQPGVNGFLKKRARWPFYLLKESNIIPEVAGEKNIDMTFYPGSEEPETMKFFRTKFKQTRPSSTLKGWQPIDLTSSKKLSASEFIAQSKGINSDYFIKPEEILNFYYMTENEQLLYARDYRHSSEFAFVTGITGSGIHTREEARSAITTLTTYLTYNDPEKRNSSNHQTDKEKAKEEFIKSMKEIFEDKVKKLEITLKHIVISLCDIPDITNEDRGLLIIKPADKALRTRWISRNLGFLLQCDISSSSSSSSSSSGYQVVWQFCRNIIILTCVYAMQAFYQKHSSTDNKNEDVWGRVYRIAEAEIDSETHDDEVPWFISDDSPPPIADKIRLSIGTETSESGYLTDKTYRKKVLTKMRKLLIRAGYRLPTRETRIELRGQAMSAMLEQYVAQFTNSDLELSEEHSLTVDMAKKIADIIATEIWSIIIDLIKDEILPPPSEWVSDDTSEHEVEKSTGEVLVRPASPAMQVDTDSDVSDLGGFKSEEDLEHDRLFDNPEIVVNLSREEKLNIRRYIDAARDKAKDCFDKAVRQLKGLCRGLEHGELQGVFLFISARDHEKLTRIIYSGSMPSDFVSGRKLPTQIKGNSTNPIMNSSRSLWDSDFTIFTKAELHTAFNEKQQGGSHPSTSLFPH